jgi:hypothetical protein
MIAPRAMPTSRYGQILPRMLRTSSFPAANRSRQVRPTDGSKPSGTFVSKTKGST